MRVKNIFSNLFLILLLTNFANAQKSEIGNWFNYSGNQKINNKLSCWNEVQYRNYNFIGDLQQLLLRTGIGYNLTENNNTVLLGYAFINSQKYLSNSDPKTGSNEDNRPETGAIIKKFFLLDRKTARLFSIIPMD